jgi:oxaloacetate decarboxylase beta subunit
LNSFGETLAGFVQSTGFMNAMNWQEWVMIGIACVLLYLAIVKGFEPLLLLPIAFGMLLVNLPLSDVYHPEYFASGHLDWDAMINNPGLMDVLYLGVKLGIYPPLIFMGVGAMVDFGPLIANPKSLLLGAAAQLGIFVAFILALLVGFAPNVRLR